MRTTIVNRQTAVAAIADRAPFRNSGGTLRGEAVDTSDAGVLHFGGGRLPDEHRHALVAGVKAGAVDFIVWSYGTPIAWTGTGGNVIPAVKYSVTTTNHQRIATMGLTAPASYVEWCRTGRRSA